MKGFHVSLIRCSLVLFLCLVSTCGGATYAHAGVYISEVAWMGSPGDADAEWIELANDGPEQTLNGWKLMAATTTPNIELSGTIPANGYLLLECTSPSRVRIFPEALGYKGAMSNDGELLTLYDSLGARVDSVDGSDKWENKGDNTLKLTAQRAGAGWITAEPTPGRTNATVDLAEPKETENTTSVTSGSTATSQSSGAGGRVIQGAKSTPKATQPLTPTLSLTIGEDRTAFVRVPVGFEADVRKEGGATLTNADVLWNFGDGSTAEGTTVQHTYRYPGTYVVVARTERPFAKPRLTAEDRFVIEVSPLAIEITKADLFSITLKNIDEQDMDLTGFTLAAGTHAFKMPAGTVLMANGSVTLAAEVTKLVVTNPYLVALYGPDRALVSQYGGSRGASAVQSARVVTPAPPLSTSASARSAARSKRPSTSPAPVEQESPVVPLTLPLDAEASDGELTASAGHAAPGEQPLWWWLGGLAGLIAFASSTVLLIRRDEADATRAAAYTLEDDD